MKKFSVICALIVILVGASFIGCRKEAKNISVGSKSFTEGYVLGALVSEMLENAGFTVDRKPGMQTYLIREALTSKQIDMYMEYTGTAYSVFLKKTEVIRNPEQLFNEVKNEDLLNNSIDWVSPIFSINDTYALAVKQEKTSIYGNTLSDLANYINANPKKVTIAVNHEFYERPDGFPAMAKFYGMNVNNANIKTMDLGIGYVAIDSGDVDVAMVYSTDGLLKKYNLFVLEDNLNFFPIYNPALSIRKEVLDKFPEIPSILKPLGETLSTEDIIKLNYLVDVEGKDPNEIAKQYLKEKGLIK